jgi:hypothetical protein
MRQGRRHELRSESTFPEKFLPSIPRRTHMARQVCDKQFSRVRHGNRKGTSRSRNRPGTALPLSPGHCLRVAAACRCRLAVHKSVLNTGARTPGTTISALRSFFIFNLHKTQVRFATLTSNRYPVTSLPVIGRISRPRSHLSTKPSLTMEGMDHSGMGTATTSAAPGATSTASMGGMGGGSGCKISVSARATYTPSPDTVRRLTEY